ncbi:type III secretion protein HrpB4 [Paraburkholderia azotifigens]|uniref:type III secretion protein HrpB4 n=1 Tax=Paraburkholderia azotifigens TaxID=2057004 RepID=UPI003170BA59
MSGVLAAGDAAQILLGWQRNARSALQWLHRDWLAAALGLDAKLRTQTHMEAALAALRARCDDMCSLAVLRVLQPAPPTLDLFSAAPAARLDALQVETALQILRMLALLARRAEVRRLVDRTTRKRLAEWIGCPLDDLLSKAVPEAPSLVDARRERSGMRALGSLDADELALEGLALLPRAGAQRMLLRFALPSADASTVSPSEDECEDAFALLRERLGPLVPEYPWLSG